jgi:predicted DNA binding CopG/RHH family protein
MAQTRSSESATDVVRRRLTDIHTWKAQGKSGRKIAEDLGLAETSYRGALKQVEAEKAQAKDILQADDGIPENQALAKVYEGIHVPTSDTSLALPAEISQLLPVMQEVQALLPVLKIMAKQWSEQQSLQQVPEEYQKYNAIYTVCLNDELIEAIKTYTKKHRLTQSEFLTAAVLRVLHNE